MKTNNLLGWFIILFALSLFAVLIGTLRTEEKQGRLIKPLPSGVQIVPDSTNKHPECNACRIAHQYSLNINLKHYGNE